MQYLPIHKLAKPLASYYNTKVVLIGDAAHAMTANLGQGACQGLEDAAVLARLLRAGSTDFSAYDTHRRRRSQQVGVKRQNVCFLSYRFPVLPPATAGKCSSNRDSWLAT